MLKRKKRIVLVVVVIAFLLILGIFIYSSYTRGPGMVLAFNKVEHFSREVSFIVTMDLNKAKAIIIDVSQPEGLSYKPVSHLAGFTDDSNFQLGGLTIAVRPDGSRFYICDDYEIFEYDNTGGLLRRIPIEEFGLGTGKYMFEGRAQALNRHVLLLVRSSGDPKEFIVKWDTEKHPKTRKIETPVLSKAPDSFGGMVLMFENGGGYYDLDAKEAVGRSWSEINSSIATESESLIHSDHLAPNRSSKIELVDIAQNSKTDITWGALAKWGPDGYIYFVRGGTQLWRCKPGTKPEPVYLVTKIVRGGTEVFGHELRFNHDRTFLAFCYRVPFYIRGLKDPAWVRHSRDPSMRHEYRCGLVLIDLKNDEYMEINPEDFYQMYLDMHSQDLISLSDQVSILLLYGRDFVHIENMAWIVESDTENMD